MSKNEITLTCPFCDKPRHLYFNVKKRVFHCFKCGKSGTASMLERMGMSLSNMGMVDIIGDVCYNLSDGVSVPPPHQAMSTQSEAYFAERGVHPAIYNMIEDKTYETDDGLVFFFPDEDYWQVRRWKHLGNPRWTNPTLAARTPAVGVVYHLRTTFDNSVVVLVEGVFDVLRVAPYANAAASLSSTIHDTQILGLLDRGYDAVIYMPDRDVPTTTRAKNISRLGAHLIVMVGPYDSDDPGSATDEELKYAIQRTVRKLSTT